MKVGGKKGLKVQKNLLDSDYEMLMVRLLVATVNWHKLNYYNLRKNLT